MEAFLGSFRCSCGDEGASTSISVSVMVKKLKGDRSAIEEKGVVDNLFMVS